MLHPLCFLTFSVTLSFTKVIYRSAKRWCFTSIPEELFHYQIVGYQSTLLKIFITASSFLLSTSFDLQKRGRGRPKGSRTKPNSSMYYKFSKNRTAKVKKGLKSDTETVQPIVSSLHVCGTFLVGFLVNKFLVFMYMNIAILLSISCKSGWKLCGRRFLPVYCNFLFWWWIFIVYLLHCLWKWLLSIIFSPVLGILSPPHIQPVCWHLLISNPF